MNNCYVLDESVQQYVTNPINKSNTQKIDDSLVSGRIC